MHILGGLLSRKRLYLVALLVSVCALLLAAAVSADDNTDWDHWHAEGTEYRLLVDQLPDNYEDRIRDAADEWADNTVVTLTESGSSNNTIWRGAIPHEWWPFCPPATSLGCTGYSYSGDHMTRAQTAYNWDFNLSTSNFKCFFNIGNDMETLAVHEFGHFVGFLNHSDDDDATMHADVGNCQRELDSHDIQSMSTQYGYSH